MRFTEITNDSTCRRVCLASNNNSEYVLSSAAAVDAYTAYVDKYQRVPSSRWYRRNFRFTRG